MHDVTWRLLVYSAVITIGVGLVLCTSVFCNWV